MGKRSPSKSDLCQTKALKELMLQRQEALDLFSLSRTFSALMSFLLMSKEDQNEEQIVKTKTQRGDDSLTVRRTPISTPKFVVTKKSARNKQFFIFYQICNKKSQSRPDESSLRGMAPTRPLHDRPRFIREKFLPPFLREFR